MLWREGKKVEVFLGIFFWLLHDKLKKLKNWNRTAARSTNNNPKTQKKIFFSFHFFFFFFFFLGPSPKYIIFWFAQWCSIGLKKMARPTVCGFIMPMIVKGSKGKFSSFPSITFTFPLLLDSDFCFLSISIVDPVVLLFHSISFHFILLCSFHCAYVFFFFSFQIIFLLSGCIMLINTVLIAGIVFDLAYIQVPSNWILQFFSISQFLNFSSFLWSKEIAMDRLRNPWSTSSEYSFLSFLFP